MAKELGIKPRSLIKNIPAKSQPWKAPVSEWLRDLHAKRFGEAHGPDPAQGPTKPSSPMAKRKEQNREDRIINEIVVDAYDAAERAMGWCHRRFGSAVDQPV